MPTTDPAVFCSGKRAFRSYDEAARSASKTAHGKSSRCRPYKCTHCGMFHYGTTYRRTGKKRPRHFLPED